MMPQSRVEQIPPRDTFSHQKREPVRYVIGDWRAVTLARCQGEGSEGHGLYAGGCDRRSEFSDTFLYRRALDGEARKRCVDLVVGY